MLYIFLSAESKQDTALHEGRQGRAKLLTSCLTHPANPRVSSTSHIVREARNLDSYAWFPNF